MPPPEPLQFTLLSLKSRTRHANRFQPALDQRRPFADRKFAGPQPEGMSAIGSFPDGPLLKA